MSYYPQAPQHPPLPPPWYSEWDERDRRTIFINPQTGERTFEHPMPSYMPSAGYGQGGYPPPGGYERHEQEYGGQGGYEHGGYGQPAGYGGYPQPQMGGYGGGYEQEKREKKSGGHGGLAYGAMGAVAGLAGGALLMHEGEKIEGDYERDKYRVENRFDNGVHDVEGFPDDAARWAGRKVQDVEDIPEDVEGRFRRTEDEIEDVPDDVAGWAGRKVGDAERFGDGVEGSYDEGRYETREEDRYDDDRY